MMKDGHLRRLPFLASAFFAIAAATVFCPSARGDEASDQPAAAPSPAVTGDDERPQPDAILHRLRSALDNLKLSDDQKAKIDGFFAATRDELRDAGDQLKQATHEDQVARIRQVIGKLRDNVASVLNDEQKQAIRERFASAGADA